MKHRIIARGPHPRRGYVVTLDDQGIVRSGPRRAWWPNLRPRVFDGLGISLEIPRWRLRAWNVAFAAGETVGAAWAHACGWSWTDLAGVTASASAAGAAWIFGALPVLAYRSDLRHAAEVAQWQAEAALVEAEVERRFLARGVDISRAAMRAHWADDAVLEDEAVAA